MVFFSALRTQMLWGPFRYFYETTHKDLRICRISCVIVVKLNVVVVVGKLFELPPFLLIFLPPTLWTFEPCPLPTLTLSASLSQLWIANSHTQPAVLKWSRWPLLPSRTTPFLVSWWPFVCLTSLPFVHLRSLQTQWILYPRATKRNSFFGPPRVSPPSLSGPVTPVTIAERGAGPDLVGTKLWGVGTSRRAIRYVWNQRRSVAILYSSVTSQAALYITAWYWIFSCCRARHHRQQMFPVRQHWLCKALGAFLYPISGNTFIINPLDIC